MLCDNKMRSVLVLLVLVTKVCSDDCPGPGCRGFNTDSIDGQVPYIQEITTHTAKPVGKPQVLSMLSEDQMVLGLQGVTTTVPSFSNTTSETRGRALDFAVGDHENVLSNSTGVKDLSDVSMDEDEDDLPIESAKILSPKVLEKNSTLGICEKGGLTYENGEKLEVGCDSVCTCSNGKMDCLDRCRTPFIRKGLKSTDPFCNEKTTEDPCCSILQCSSDTETEPLEICNYKNKTYNRGDVIQEGCLEVCSCEAGGKLSCKPRCSPITKPIDNKCLEIPDMNDPCCKTVICDVTLKDNKLISAKYVNTTTIKLDFDSKIEPNQTLPLMDISNDKMTWKTFTPLPGGFLSGLDTTYKYAKIENTDDIIEIQNMDDGSKKIIKDKSKYGKGCEHKGKDYKIGDEFNDGCDFFCACKESGVKCLKMECPTYFGTDVLDPNCLEWETVPANFTPVAPICCPEKLHCKNNGSCVYKGEVYQNWQQVPSNVTGCEKRCYCEMGTIDCQNICPPVTALPPDNLECPPQRATLSHLPGDDCCVYWMCSSNKDNLNGRNSTVETIPKQNVSIYDSGPSSEPPTNLPDQILGPLLIYTNKSNKTDDDSPTKPTKPTKDDKNSNSKLLDTTPFLGPFNPNYKPSSTKQNNKNNKSKPRPTPSTPSKDNNIDEDQPIKNFESYPLPNAPHIRIHGKGNPEELLHIINQHPDLANYPPGSVLEIHNIPTRNDFPNQNKQNTPKKNIHLPPGVTLEQILQDIHKNSHANSNSFNQNLLYPQPNNNGQVYMPQFNGRPQQNSTGLGHPGMYPGNFNNLPGYHQQPQDDIQVNILEALDASTIRLAFTVPPVIVGLHGRVEVRYTHREDDDPNSWELQIFAPPSDLIATPQLEFDLVELRPDTEYRIKITVRLRDLHNTPTSRVYKIRTLKAPLTSTLPPMIPIDPDMVITDINATWVNVAWRKFTEYELQFIDGVQLRFKEIDGKIYAATPLIHRAVTTYTLENLKPNSKYEIGIFFIPFSGQLTELHAEHMLHFTTANEVDTYGFNVTLEISLIKPTNVEISWSGVPYPEDKYVNIYRAIYQSDSGKSDLSTFKVAKRDSPSKSIITDLKPGTRYRLWLEIYLTNGKIKTSNVQDFITKPRSAPNLGASSKQDKLSGEPEDRGDYYGPLVIVAILAAIAILSTLVLLLILVRRHGQNKACITPPQRVSQSAYDNPTYKVEIQQETMDL